MEVSKDVSKKEAVQEDVMNQDIESDTEEACDCSSECNTDEAQNACEADESDEADDTELNTDDSKKKDPKDAVIEELQDRVKRQMAEFDNFRKRTEKEKSTMFDMGARSVIEKLLPVVDNFERGLASITEEQRGPVYDGMNMIYKQLMDELDKMDVKPIEALGQPFDPNLHNAVMQVESEEFESGVVAQELQKGYTHHGSVVRHSMVSVVK